MQEKFNKSGFGSMDAAKQREIARKGGRAAHRKGTAHEFNSDEARFAGRKGGEQVSADRSHMIEIGRLGGKRSAERRRTSLRSTSSSFPGASNQEQPDQESFNEKDAERAELFDAGSGSVVAGRNAEQEPQI